MPNADSVLKNAAITMCTQEDFKFIQASTQEIILFTAAAMLCKQIVTSKQEEGGLIGVCHAFWITVPQLVPVKEDIQPQQRDHFQFMVE